MRQQIEIGNRWAELADQYRSAPSSALHNAHDQFMDWADTGVSQLLKRLESTIEQLHLAGALAWQCAVQDGQVAELTVDLVNCRNWLAGDGDHLVAWVWDAIPRSGSLWDALIDHLDDEAHLDAVMEVSQ